MNLFESITRLFTGTYEFKKEEQRREEEATWHDKSYNARVGGILGLLNKIRAGEASRYKGGSSSRGE